MTTGTEENVDRRNSREVLRNGNSAHVALKVQGAINKAIKQSVSHHRASRVSRRRLETVANVTKRKVFYRYIVMHY